MTNNINKLENRLAAAANKIQKIDALNQLAWALREKEPKRALALSKEARNLAHSDELEPYQKGLAQSLANLGYLNYYQANYHLSLSQSFDAIALFEAINYPKGLPTPLGIVGINYLRLGNYSEALDYFYRQLKLCEELGDKFNQAKAFNGMGIVYSHTNEHAQSKACFNKALHIFRQIAEKREEATALMNCCLGCRNMGDYEDALACGFHSLQICREIDDKARAAMSLYNLGETYVASGTNEDALAYFEQSLDLAKEIDDKFVQSSTLLSLGKVYYKQQQLKLAQSYLHQAVTIAVTIQDKRTLFDTHKALAETYKAQGDFQAALSHYEQFHLLKEEIFNEEAARKLKTLEVIYQTEAAQKEAELYQLKSEELAKLNADKDRFFSIVAHDLRAPFAPLLGALELLLDVARESNLQNIALISENALLSARQIFELLENLLQWASLQMGRIKYKPEPLNLRQATEQSTKVLGTNAATKGISIDNLVMDNILVHADKNMLDAILRNLLNNALKFTEPGGKVTISARLLSITDEKTTFQSSVEVSVTDTGVGISPEELDRLFKPNVHHSTTGTAQEKGTGLGLILCKEMVEWQGGQIWIESEVDKGTTVKFTMPLSEELSG